MRALASAVLVVAIACGPSKGPTAGGGLEAPPQEDLFAIDRLLHIELTVDAADWDKARKEHHDMERVFGERCLEGPAKRPYNYVPATMKVDGGEPMSVEIRKKGFLGSVSETRPSLKVRLGKKGFRGATRLTLNNNKQDASQIHQCVAYRAFARAGVPAPRCSLARVTVNGESLGIYSNVESLKRPFLRRAFGSDKGELFEGNVSDFRPGWINTMQQKTKRKTPNRASLDGLVAALAKPDGELVAALEGVLDLDAFMTYWAMERLVGHWDGYSNNQNNYYIYRRARDGRFQFIPWGADAVLGSPDLLSRIEPPASVYAASVLPHRLYAIPSMRARYLARLRELLDAWDDTAMLAEIETLEAITRPHLHISEAAFDQGLTAARTFIRQRRTTVGSAIAGTPESWRAALRSSPCSVKGGIVEATFETTWNKAPPMNPIGAGKVDFKVTAGDAPMAFRATGTTATANEQSAHKPTVGLFGMRDDGVLVMVFATVEPDKFADGAVLSLESGAVTGIMLEMNLQRGSLKIGGFLSQATLELTEAGTTDGAAVKGRLRAEISHPGHWLDKPLAPAATAPETTPTSK